MDDIYISKDRQSSEIDFVFLDDEPSPVPPEQNDPPKKKKRKKKKFRFFKAITAFVLVLFVLSSSLVFLFASASGYTRKDWEANPYIASSELTSSPLVTNILLLGVDESINGPARSDSMMLVSIDYAHMKIKLTSFLRDSWVYIPSKDRKAKLNAACTYGGAQLVKDTIEYNFGIKIDHYVMVDFEMFTQIIDGLGGVDVEVTEKEAAFINRTTRYTIDSGESVHLNGNTALVYCRIRKLDSDYMRTYRQRKVITALVQKAKKAGFPVLMNVLSNVFPLIQTDMSPFEISMLAEKSGIPLLTFEMQQSRVPRDEDLDNEMISGQAVVTLDLEATREYLYDYIYTDKVKFE